MGSDMKNESDTVGNTAHSRTKVEGTASEESGDASGAESYRPFSSMTEGDIAELAGKAAKADEHWERLLRMTAEFDNFKKRAARDRQEAIRYANESLLEKLIPALDNFEMALSASEGLEGAASEAIKTGVNMVYQHLKSVIADAGLETLDASRGAFDPNWQEAVSELETDDVPEGHVAQQLRKGYRLKDRLLRPARVVVARKAKG